jgi:hypothetical protein
VGHIFQLRTKYAEALKCSFLDEGGQSRIMEMGCYGIGVTRIVGAAIEQGHDERGIIFPAAIAPFQVCIVPMAYAKSEAVRAAADALYAELTEAGIDVLLDDRNERPGVMFAEMELIGIPHRVVVGERGLAEGKLEYKGRVDSRVTDDRQGRDRPVPEGATMRYLTALFAFLLPLAAHAGAQKYEPLSASVQAVLTRSISDRAPPRSSFQDSMDAIDWLTEMSRRLEKRIPDREARFEFLRAVHYEATRSGLDPQLVLGLIQVESGFKKYAVSSAGARGFMQVMPFWVKVVGSSDDNLFHLRTNSTLRLHHSSPLPRHRAWRSVPRARSLQRQPWPAPIPECGSRGVAESVVLHQEEAGDALRRAPCGAQRIPGIIPLRPRISCDMPPRENCFIIFWVCSNCFSRRLTSCT